MRGVWLRSHTLQLIINMQSLLALPQSSLQSELLIRLIKLYQISQGRSSLMLMRQPKQTPAPLLMKAAAACAAREPERIINGASSGRSCCPGLSSGTWQGVCISSPGSSLAELPPFPGLPSSLENGLGQLQEPGQVGSVRAKSTCHPHTAN